MIEVHVWDSRWAGYVIPRAHGSPGHASIQINETYVSFWPPGPGNPFSGWKGYQLHTLDEDRRIYSASRQAEWHRLIPDRMLDIPAMLNRWTVILKSVPDYSWKFQCSAVVHDLLETGGGDRWAWGLSSWAIGAWSPADVRDYVESMGRWGLNDEP